MSKNGVKKAFKAAAIVVAVLLALDFLIVGLLFVPGIQTAVVRKVTSALSEKWGSEFSIAKVRITPALKVVAHDVTFKDHHGNNMIYSKKVKVRLKSLKLDPVSLGLGDVEFENPEITLRTYKGEDDINVSVWASKFPKSPDDGSTFTLTANSVAIEDGMFVLIDDNKRRVFDTKGNPDIDYSFFELENISIQADDFLLVNDDISMKINDLSFKQYGGFDLERLSGDFRICSKELDLDNLKIKTDNSDLDLDLNFSYDSWKTYADFLDSVLITSRVRPSVLYFGDVAGFAPAVKGMNEVFYVDADSLHGYVTDFTLDKFKVSWLGGNFVSGSLSARDIISIKEASFDVKLDSSSVYLADVNRFALPKGKTLKLPASVAKIGKVAIDGTFEGSLNKFIADINAGTKMGPVSAKLETVPIGGRTDFAGRITSKGFNLAGIAAPKVFGRTALDISLDGFIPSQELTAEAVKNAEAHISGDIGTLSIKGYPFRNIKVDGDYQNRLYNATLSIDDRNAVGKAVVQLDISNPEPMLQGSVSVDDFRAGEIASILPKVDSATAAGFDKVLLALQKNPSVKLSFDNFQVNLRGDNIENVNGFIGCDNVKFHYNEDSLQNERLRLTAINTERVHKFILSSNIANASFESTYPLNSVKDTLLSIAHRILPSIVKAGQKSHSASGMEDNSGGYLRLNVHTYNTRPLIRLFYPDMLLASNSVVKIDIGRDNAPDLAEVSLPFFAVRNKFRLHNFRVDGTSSDQESLHLNMTGDSAVVNIGKGKLVFDKVSMTADETENLVDFDLSWHNPFNADANISRLKGVADITTLDDIGLSFAPSEIYLKDYECHFNDSNEVRIRPHMYLFDNLEFFTRDSYIAVNGVYDTKEDSKLTAAAKNVDMSLVNPLLDNMSFDGRLFANLSLHNWEGRRLVLGKTIVDEFSMNGSRLGDMFLVAGLSQESEMRFAGGLFNATFPIGFETLSSYNMQTFQDEKNKTADISGTYADGKLAAHAIFDTLNADFLSPFLSSFSDNFTGTASGDLYFHASPDSTYLDGTVHVVDASMGIAPLGTEYSVRDQDIRFNRQGIFFDGMVIADPDGNMAVMRGNVLHNMFKDILVDLNIKTDRILALNTVRTANSFFYGKGYVKGEVSIKGDGNTLSFSGPDITTLQGSSIALQVLSASSASETEMIHFKVKAGEKDNNVETKSSTALNFDFTFNVTNDADVQLYIESIGGTMNARADGRFQLLYNDDLNLYGNLLLHSGDFKISLYGVVNSKFTLVPGGAIVFDGPVENMTVDLQAYKTSRTSLSNIIPAQYLPSGNVDVNSSIHLSGPLMRRLEPTFGFELPNSSSEVRNLFYTAIDTQNTENMTKQFAYFLITNSFMPENMFSSNSSGPSGLGIFSNIVNNMLGNVIDSKVGTFGITYNQATETSSAEYGLKANANILKDRVTMSTSIGYYDDRTSTNAYNNMYGNFAVEYNLNKSGTWKLKAYTYIGDRDNEYFYESTYNNYTAGVAMSYKKDFDIRKRRKKSSKEKTSKHEQQ